MLQAHRDASIQICVPNKGLNYRDTQLPGAEYLCNTSSKMSDGVEGRKMDWFKASV